MAWYSMGPGLPEQAASTAQALALTSGGSGSTVSLRQSGGFCVFCLAMLLVAVYILSGTSMPRSCMPFLMTLATFLASTRRTRLSPSVSALRML